MKKTRNPCSSGNFPFLWFLREFRVKPPLHARFIANARSGPIMG
jgi:hypothetical protein